MGHIRTKKVSHATMKLQELPITVLVLPSTPTSRPFFWYLKHVVNASKKTHIDLLSPLESFGKENPW
jgi:hypothetical protein